ncbi:DUF3221 domain-containing protein [Oceanobacillus jeddahense]|uniref:DUF3221 domain-containing protein n=1 Tax=Oceanobacillus jeddahense TaxID=1462527 RepID=UPI0005958CC1|nr:DUF3221 domain-containing protein [Oceanobacillus jeddahense]
MKKGIFLIITIVLFSIMVLIFFKVPVDQADENEEDSIDIIDDEESTLQGYYFNGYIDMRKPFESFDEVTTYMYYMNNYLKEYLNQTVLTDDKKEDEDYVHYFNQLEDSIYPISFQNKYDLNNGDYVKVTYKGGIKESYPAQIGEIIDVEVMDLKD